MLKAVFISDLHLHPNSPKLTKRFEDFLDWALSHTQSIYILGDFFDAWAGDDDLDEWSYGIAKRLAYLHDRQIELYFMPGNRDFLLGKTFFQLAGMIPLLEPQVINLGQCNFLLAHGDGYCTSDKKHQWLRRITRNRYFPPLFLSLPLNLRKKMVASVRQQSQMRGKKRPPFDIVPAAMIKHLQHYGVTTIIHGHTHKPGLRKHEYNDIKYHQYVLSDWDNQPQILCYDEVSGLRYRQFRQ